MRPEMEALGQRAIACRRWFWMPGMLTATGIRLTGHQRPGYVRGEVDIPDLTDPATMGCLLALVREAYWSQTFYACLSDPAPDGIRFWQVIGWLDPKRSPKGLCGSFRAWGYASEAEALVAALEAAP